LNEKISIVIPAKNEAEPLPALLGEIRRRHPDAELIVVDDGSSDDTAAVAEKNGARVIRHRYSMGNGAAIKAGARAATGDVLVFMDADGQHDPADIARLLDKFDEGFDLVVGARDRGSQASLARMFGNGLYNRLASWMVGHPIADLTSGFRAVRAALFRDFLYLLPNGFSYPTTSTMAFFRAGHAVAYVPIRAHKRQGKASHIRLLRDGSRFFLIIFKVGVLYSPLKLFTPLSAIFFAAGCWYYTYTYVTTGRFTNMGVLLFLSSALLFMLGLLSEQITTLMYMRVQDESARPRR
jgi:glycosyltransferase involved in cell wall biosynthesis